MLMPERRTLCMDATQARAEKRVEGDEEQDVVTGYAAVFYDGSKDTEYRLWDDYIERIAPGAFADVVESDVRGLFNHDADNILGRTEPGTLSLSEDDTGLKYEIEMPDTQMARDLATSIQRGDVSGSSFSFSADKTTIEEVSANGNTTIIRTIQHVGELFDVGPVTFPAYGGTQANMRDADTTEAEKERSAYEGQKTETTNEADTFDFDAREREMEMRMRMDNA